jgi:hypothetical protein
MMKKVFIPSCHFCGARIGDISERTNEKTTAIYDCEKCRVNYCDQCNYSKKEAPEVQLCLRCDSRIEKLV